MIHNKRKIFFRADGNSLIGLGHIYRCIAIAERAIEYYECYFAIQRTSDEILKLIQCFASLIILEESNDYKAESELLFQEILPKIKPDIVILDGYSFDTSYQKIIIQNHFFNLVCIDDDQPHMYLSDVVINHAEGLNYSKVLLEPYTKLFIGFKYAMIRKAFLANRALPRHIQTISNLFICFGGGDLNGVTIKALKASLNCQKFKQIQVVIGEDFLYEKELNQIQIENPSIFIHKNMKDYQMVELLNSSDLAIVPASTISIECLFSGLVLLTGTTVSNQQNILNGLVEKDFIKSIGDFNKISILKLEKAINDLINNFCGYTFSQINLMPDPLLEIFNSL